MFLFCFFIIQEGNANNLMGNVFIVLLEHGNLLFSHLYMYMKNCLDLVSDVSLLELSDTNSKLLKELSDKAPGTFHHSYKWQT